MHVFLVPGFFGFANLGDFAYFGHVRDTLTRALSELGAHAQVHVVHTPPTASLPRRATRLLEALAATAGSDEAPLHLVGHSSGGLDARLLLSPGASFPTAFSAEAYAARVRSLVTVSTPHRGTPVASFFTSLLGQRLLQLLSLSTIYALRVGSLPLSALAEVTRMFTGREGGKDEGLFVGLIEEMLGGFTADRRATLRQFMTDVGEDQALMLQLAPDSMELFNASTRDRPQVRYGCVVTRARPPGLGSRLAAGLSAYAHATHTLYDALYRLAAGMDAKKLLPLSEATRAALVAGLGELPSATDNDGVVPTLSQPWGDVIACAVADHLDVLGHFAGEKLSPPHHDWLCTGSGFSREAFEQVWHAVARWLLAPTS
ncbi:MAG: esterase/lipase family protein [Myxococcota bacterium]